MVGDDAVHGPPRGHPKFAHSGVIHDLRFIRPPRPEEPRVLVPVGLGAAGIHPNRHVDNQLGWSAHRTPLATQFSAPTQRPSASKTALAATSRNLSEPTETVLQSQSAPSI